MKDLQARRWHRYGTDRSPVDDAAGRQRGWIDPALHRQRSWISSFISRAFVQKTKERTWRASADAEQTVSARLEKLTKQGWHVLHAVPVGGHGIDIDHLLIGPGGVFTVNSKLHRGKSVVVNSETLRVDGWATDYIHRTRHESARVQRLLSAALGPPVEVRATLVLIADSGNQDISYQHPPRDVLVLGGGDVPSFFKRAKRQLSDVQIATIHEAACRATAWGVPTA